MLVFPFSSSVSRRLASLHRIARGSLLRLPRYHQGAPTSCRPSRQTPFRSSGDATHHCGARGSGESLLAGSLSELRRCLNPLPSSALVEIGRISQVPGQPLREHALLFDPGGPAASGHCDASDIAFPSVDSVGSAFRHLSRLNHTACSLAVYASQLGLLRLTPRKTHYPLTATLGGAGLEPAGLHSKVSLRNITSHHVDPPSPSFAWRSNRRDAVILVS